MTTLRSRSSPGPAPAVGENIAGDFARRMPGPSLLAAGTLLLTILVAVSTVVRCARNAGFGRGRPRAAA